MSITSARAAPCLVPVLLWILPGCAGLTGLSEDAPAGYSIAGEWTLDPAHSTDTRKLLAELRAERERDQRPGPGGGPDAGPEPLDPTTAGPPAPASGRHGGGGGGGQAGGIVGVQDRYRPPLDVQTDVLKGGEWLRIQQSDAEVDIANGDSARSFTPGRHSVVSVPSGVADQDTGWKGRSYVIELRPQVGPRVVESYGLSDDGHQLIVNISVDSEGRNRALRIVRVYGRSASARQTLPVND